MEPSSLENVLDLLESKTVCPTVEVVLGSSVDQTCIVSSKRNVDSA